MSSEYPNDEKTVNLYLTQRFHDLSKKIYQYSKTHLGKNYIIESA